MLVSGVVGMSRLRLREGLALHLNAWGVYFARHFQEMIDISILLVFKS